MSEVAVMPVRCESEIRNIPQGQFATLDYTVMRHIFDAQNDIGRLADERIYSTDIAGRIRRSGMMCHRETKLELSFNGFQKDLLLDLVVDNCGIYELKTASTLTPRHRSQLMTYLYLLDIEHGKLVNLRGKKVESEFVNAIVPRFKRCGFEIDSRRSRGDPTFVDLVTLLLRDWGTCLSVSLYREYVCWLNRSRIISPQSLPLQRNGNLLGNQRFWLLDNCTAFEFTSFSGADDDYQRQLQRLLNLSPLSAIHHVNVDTHNVTFSTLHRTSDFGTKT